MKRPHDEYREDEVEEEELVVDEYGRVAGTSKIGLDFSFQAMIAPLNHGIDVLRRLREQCDMVFGSEDSFWMPADFEPRLLLERLAKDIFNYHTRNVDWSQADRESSGAEWWCQKRANNTTSSAPSHSSIGFHFDKDEDMVDSSDICLCPQISTVTYLSGAGAPTVICEKAAPLDYSDLDELYDESGFERVVISHPYIRVEGQSVAVKTIAFDGRFLHGAAVEMKRKFEGDDEDQTRYTFLVNVWINHRPEGLDLLPDKLVCLMKSDKRRNQEDIQEAEGIILKVGSATACRQRRLVASSSVPMLESQFGPSASEHKVSFGLHPSLMPDQATGGLVSSRHCTITLDLSTCTGSLGKIGPGDHCQHYSSDMCLDSVPTYNMRDSKDMTEAWCNVSSLFERYQLVLVKGGAQGSDGLPGSFGLKELSEVHKTDPEAVKRTWCIEQKDSKASETDLSPAAVLSSSGEGSEEKLLGSSSPWYCSFVLNKGKGLDKALSLLTYTSPSFFPEHIKHASSLWMFFGSNPSKKAMKGRPEHTDKITASGTWHMQASGSKMWLVRPNTEGSWPSCNRGGRRVIPSLIGSERLRVEVEEGDLLIINTSLWWHATELPPMKKKGQVCKALSLSYARDFTLMPSECSGHDEGEGEEEEEEVDHDNLDDVWASCEIPNGAIIARGEEARSLAERAKCEDGVANCKLVNKGRGAKQQVVVAVETIAEGESLRVGCSFK